MFLLKDIVFVPRIINQIQIYQNEMSRPNEIKLIYKAEYTGVLKSTSPSTSCTKENQSVFRIMKTLKPDVYELYGMKNEDLNKVGVALVQTISDVVCCVKYFKTGIRARGYIFNVNMCRFQKWKPMQVQECDKYNLLYV